MHRSYRNQLKKEMVSSCRKSPYSNMSINVKPERYSSFHMKHKILKHVSSPDKKGFLSNCFQNSSKRSQFIDLESHSLIKTTKLYERTKTILKTLSPDLDSEGKFMAVQEIIDTFIEYDISLEKPLKLLNRAYKDIFQACKTEEKLMNDEKLEKLNTEIKNSKDIMQDMARNIDYLSKENIKLGNLVEEKQRGIDELQLYLKEISSVSFETAPTNLETWKYIFNENKNFYHKCIYLTGKLHNKKQKEKELSKLIDIFRDKGYPVDQIIESERKEKERVVSDTDNEVLVSCSCETVQECKRVPRLNIKKTL